MSNLKQLLAVFFVCLGLWCLSLSKVYSQNQIVKNFSAEDISCIGSTLAYYMDVVLHARDLHKWQRVKVVSPVFGLGGGQDLDIFKAMEKHYAEFEKVDAFAGNVYSTTCHNLELGIPNPYTAPEHYANSGFRGAFTQDAYKNTNGTYKPVILTEFGDFCLVDYSIEKLLSAKSAAESITATQEDRDRYTDLLAQRRARILSMTNEYNTIVTSFPEVTSINLFNAFNTNSDWKDFELTKEDNQYDLGLPAEIPAITAPDYSKGGINAANDIIGKNLYSPTSSLGLTWTVEIFRNYPQADSLRQQKAQEEANKINAAFDVNPKIQPVLRPCTGQECAFENPSDLVDFLDRLDPLLKGSVWVTAGPNEPSLEHWLSDGCDPCENYVIDPDHFPDKNIPPECVTMKISDDILLSNEYEATCDSKKDITVISSSGPSGDLICTGGDCQTEGSAAYQLTPTIIPLLQADNPAATNADELFKSYSNYFAYTDSSLPIEAQPAAQKLNNNYSQYLQTINYLKRLAECLHNLDQTGCYIAKKIRGGIKAKDEKDFLDQLQRAHINLEDLAYKTVVDTSSKYSSRLRYQYEVLLDKVGLLDDFYRIQPFIYSLVPAYRVTSIDTISPLYQDGLWGGFQAFLDRFKNETPTIKVEEFLMSTSTLTPLDVTGQIGGVQYLSNTILPRSQIDEYAQTLELDRTPTKEELALYMKGPIIFNLDRLAFEKNTSPLTNTVAAKVNKDRPVCQVTNYAETSALSTHDAYSGQTQSLNFLGRVTSLIRGIVSTLQAIPPSSEPAPQQAVLRNFIVAPTRHEQQNLDDIYQLMTNKYLQDKDEEEKHITDKVEVVTQEESDQPTLPHRTNLAVRQNAGTFILGVPFRNVVPEFLGPLQQTDCYAPQVWGESIPGCNHVYTILGKPTPVESPPPTTPNSCTASSALPELPQNVPSTQRNQTCVQVWTDKQTAEQHAEELKQVLAFQQQAYVHPNFSFVGWAPYFIKNDPQNNAVNQHLFGSCCGQSPCYDYLIGRTLAETYVDPYVTIAISLNENGGLYSTDPQALDGYHFGCNVNGDKYNWDIGDKLTCALKTLNISQALGQVKLTPAEGGATVSGADAALIRYGYRYPPPEEGGAVELDKSGTYNANLNYIIWVLSEGKYSGLCHP